MHLSRPWAPTRSLFAPLVSKSSRSLTSRARRNCSMPRDRDPELVNDPLSVDRSRSLLIAGIRGRFAGRFVGTSRGEFLID